MFLCKVRISIICRNNIMKLLSYKYVTIQHRFPSQAMFINKQVEYSTFTLYKNVENGMQKNISIDFLYIDANIMNLQCYIKFSFASKKKKNCDRATHRNAKSTKLFFFFKKKKNVRKITFSIAALQRHGDCINCINDDNEGCTCTLPSANHLWYVMNSCSEAQGYACFNT